MEGAYRLQDVLLRTHENVTKHDKYTAATIYSRESVEQLDFHAQCVEQRRSALVQ